MAFIFGGQYEWIILLFVALMLFGKRLPEVARSMGKGLTEFKKGIRGVEDDVHGATSYDPGPTAERPVADDDLTNVSAPKFTPPAFDIDPEQDADGTPSPTAGSDAAAETDAETDAETAAETDAGDKVARGES
jgi:sec-independent protein translocase protein TatA